MIGRTLIAGAASLFLSVSMADAADFTIHMNMNMPRLDIPSPEMPHPPDNPLDINPPLPNTQAEVNLCQWHCDHNPRCMAFTWVRRGIQGATAKCWFKRSARILENHGLGLMTVDANTVTGVKIYQSRACWARHLFNLKFCNVVDAGFTSTASPPTDRVTLECPPLSMPAFDGRGPIRGRIDRFCVVRLANDPGGLPNCTDAFGGAENTVGVLGNRVNHACLDAN
jgi:hypothetical protein